MRSSGRLRVLEREPVRGRPEPRHRPLEASRPLLPGPGAAVQPKALHAVPMDQVLRVNVEWEHPASFHLKYLEIKLLRGG
jgi:hypothetical protein